MKLRVGVIGVGPMGRGHVKHYRGLPGCDLVAVVDSDPARRAEAAIKSGARAFADFRELIGRVDAVSIATPTTTHRDIALPLIEAGIHVLIEKPLAQDPAAGEEIVRAARAQGVVLQVGHIERFNPAFRALNVPTPPVFIECRRTTDFDGRDFDVSVVLDLMIHDLDIVLSLVPSEVTRIAAHGYGVQPGKLDYAHATLLFKNNCRAHLTVSRVATIRERRMHCVLENGIYVVDFLDRTTQHLSFSPNGRHKSTGHDPGNAQAASRFAALNISHTDALRDEQSAFVACIRENTPPVVSGMDGLRALKIAREIETRISETAQATLPADNQRPG